MRDEPLFDVPASAAPPRLSNGPMRTSLEAEIQRVDPQETELSASGLAQLRMLADHLDSLSSYLWRSPVKPYDRVPLVQLAAQFDSTYDRVFDAMAGGNDALDAALREFSSTEADRSAAAHDAGPLAAD